MKLWNIVLNVVLFASIIFCVIALKSYLGQINVLGLSERSLLVSIAQYEQDLDSTLFAIHQLESSNALLIKKIKGISRKLYVKETSYSNITWLDAINLYRRNTDTSP